MKAPWRLSEISLKDVRATPPEVAVITFGATEPHNLHLPYGTDNFEVTTIADRACERAWNDGARVVLLPNIPFGNEQNLFKFPLAIHVEQEVLNTIVESVDKSFLQRNYGEDSGYLYKFDYPADQSPYYWEDKGSSPATYVPHPFQPETHEDDPKPEFVSQWIQAINQSSETTFRSTVGEYIDLFKLMRHVAVEVFVTDYDGFIGDFGTNNFYLYRFDNKKQFVFIPWDKSEAFKGGYGASIWHNINDVPDAKKNRLIMRALAYTDLYNYFLDTLLECAQSAAQLQPDGRGWMQSEIDREYQQIRAAAIADQEKPFSNADFENEVNALRAFATNRSAVVSAQVVAARP